MSEWSATERLFVGASYVLTWVVLMGYGVYCGVRLRSAERMLDRSVQGEEESA